MFKKENLMKRKASLLESFRENEKIEWGIKVTSHIVDQLDEELEKRIVEDVLEPGKMEFHYEVPIFQPVSEDVAIKKLQRKFLRWFWFLLALAISCLCFLVFDADTVGWRIWWSICLIFDVVTSANCLRNYLATKV